MDEIIEMLTSAGLSVSRKNKNITINNTRQEICRVWEGVLGNIEAMEGMEFESSRGTFYDRIYSGCSHFMINEGVTPDDKKDYSNIFPGATLVDAIPEQEMYIQYDSVMSDDEVNDIVSAFFPEKDVMVYFLHSGKEVLTVERTEGKIYYFNDRRAGPSKVPDMDLGEWLDH